MTQVFISNDAVDLAPLFQVTSTRNYLLGTLGIFETVPVQNHKVAISRLLEDNRSLLNIPTARFSNEHNSTARQNGQEWLVEIPYFLREDVITPGDIQGRRRTGEDISETLTALYADYMHKHAVAFMRTRESYLARALFKGEVNTPKTQDVLIDYKSLFGTVPMEMTTSVTSLTSPLLHLLDQMHTDITEAAQSQAAAVERIVIFAKPDWYTGVRSSAALERAMQYVSPFDERNIFYAQKELLPGVSTFTIPSTNIDVIKVTEKLLLDQFPDDVFAIAIPTFDSKAGVYQNIVGAASSNFDLLNAPSAESYSWAYKSERGDAYNVISENSSLPVNHGLNFSVHIKDDSL